ncbi:MAG: hypothetical protein ACYDC8_16915 [Gammaproteobacteria bacterium]
MFSNQETATILVALRMYQQSVDSIGISKMTDAYPHFEDEAPLDADTVDSLCERINSGLSVTATTDGHTPTGIRLTPITGDNPDYGEIRVGAFNGITCVADVLIGVSPDNELRVLITTGGCGDGEHPVTVFPLRATDNAVTVDRQ